MQDRHTAFAEKKRNSMLLSNFMLVLDKCSLLCTHFVAPCRPLRKKTWNMEHFNSDSCDLKYKKINPVNQIKFSKFIIKANRKPFENLLAASANSCAIHIFRVHNQM